MGILVVDETLPISILSLPDANERQLLAAGGSLRNKIEKQPALDIERILCVQEVLTIFIL